MNSVTGVFWIATRGSQTWAIWSTFQKNEKIRFLVPIPMVLIQNLGWGPRIWIPSKPLRLTQMNLINDGEETPVLSFLKGRKQWEVRLRKSNSLLQLWRHACGSPWAPALAPLVLTYYSWDGRPQATELFCLRAAAVHTNPTASAVFLLAQALERYSEPSPGSCLVGSRYQGNEHTHSSSWLLVTGQSCPSTTPLAHTRAPHPHYAPSFADVRSARFFMLYN